MPSISNGKSSRRRSRSSWNACTAAMSSATAYGSATWKPHAASCSRSCVCVPNSKPSTWPIAKAKNVSGRDFTVRGSMSLSVPATVLRALRNVPSVDVSSLSRSVAKSLRLMMTSPRTSIRAGTGPSPSTCSGRLRTVRRLLEMSSPDSPLPRDSPRTKRPFS